MVGLLLAFIIGINYLCSILTLPDYGSRPNSIYHRYTIDRICRDTSLGTLGSCVAYHHLWLAIETLSHIYAIRLSWNASRGLYCCHAKHAASLATN